MQVLCKVQATSPSISHLTSVRICSSSSWCSTSGIHFDVSSSTWIAQHTIFSPLTQTSPALLWTLNSFPTVPMDRVAKLCPLKQESSLTSHLSFPQGSSMAFLLPLLCWYLAVFQSWGKYDHRIWHEGQDLDLLTWGEVEKCLINTAFWNYPLVSQVCVVQGIKKHVHCFEHEVSCSVQMTMV